MLNRENIETLLHNGGNVVGTDGEKIGSIGQLYADDDTGEPTWVTVKTGLFGTSQSFVPVEGAHSQDNDLVVPYTKDHVKDAPRVDVDGHLTPEEEDRLYTHYDRGVRTYSDTQDEVDRQGDADLNAGTPIEGIDAERGGPVRDGYVSGGTVPDEDVRGGAGDETARDESGRGRLRRFGQGGA